MPAPMVSRQQGENERKSGVRKTSSPRRRRPLPVARARAQPAAYRTAHLLARLLALGVDRPPPPIGSQVCCASTD